MNVLRAAVLPILRGHDIAILLSGKGLIILILYPSALKPLSCRNMLRNLLCEHSPCRIPCVNWLAFNGFMEPNSASRGFL